MERRACVICMDDFVSYYLAGVMCGHRICSPCISEMFKGAITNESRYPPRCCVPISLETAPSFLNWEIAKQFEEKKVEWDTENRTYCSNEECGAFVRPRNIHGTLAYCSRCQRVTCTNCKRVGHGDRPCVDDEGVQQALQLINQNNWRRCSSCRNGVERIDGCNHMTLAILTPSSHVVRPY